MKKYNKNIEDLFEKAKNTEPVLSQEEARSLVESGLKYSNHSNVNFKGKTAMAILTTSIAAAAWWSMSMFIAPTVSEQIGEEIQAQNNKIEIVTEKKQSANNTQNSNSSIAANKVSSNNNANQETVAITVDADENNATIKTNIANEIVQTTDNTSQITMAKPQNTQRIQHSERLASNSLNSETPIQVKGVNILNLNKSAAEKIGIAFEGDMIKLVGLEKSPTPALITLQRNNVTTDIGSPLVKSLPKLSPRFITDANGNRLISMFTSEKMNTLVSNTNADSGDVKIKEKRIYHQFSIDTNNLAEKNKLKDVHIVTKTRTTATVMRDGKPVTQSINRNNSNVDLTIKIDQIDGNTDDVNLNLQDLEDNNGLSDQDLIILGLNHQNTVNMVDKYLGEIYEDSLKFCKTRLDSNQLFERLVQVMAKKIVLPNYDTSSNKSRISVHIDLHDTLGKELATEYPPMNIDDIEKMKLAIESKDSNFSVNVIVMDTEANLEFEINKLVPVGVGFEPNKTDYIIWYEPSKELAENLPAEYSNPLLVEFNALNKSGEFCGSQPVAGEPVFDTWRACSGAIENMSAFPNPASDYINLKFNLNGERTLNIAINDLYGKEQVRLSNSEKLAAGEHTKQYNFKALPAGMYLVVVQTEQGETAVQRIIVE